MPREGQEKGTKKRIANSIPACNQASVATTNVCDANMLVLTASKGARNITLRHCGQILNMELTVIAESCLRITVHILPQPRTRRLDWRRNFGLHMWEPSI